MKVMAIMKYARISPRKVREITLEIQGLPVGRALEVVDSIPRKAARLVSKALRSAIGNAETNANLSRDSLRVAEAIAGTGPTLKRYTFRARGSGSLIRKRTTHVRIVLSDE
ncbi:MAG: 50S ribosomal protein L22 [Verrucomicrobiia bacterium]